MLFTSFEFSKLFPQSCQLGANAVERREKTQTPWSAGYRSVWSTTIITHHRKMEQEKNCSLGGGGAVWEAFQHMDNNQNMKYFENRSLLYILPPKGGVGMERGRRILKAFP